LDSYVKVKELLHHYLDCIEGNGFWFCLRDESADDYFSLKLIMLSRYRDSFSNRVLAPEGELLSFAPQATRMWRMPKMQEHNRPKASNQRKGDPIAAHILCSSHLCPVGYLSGDGKRGFLPLCRRAASLPHLYALGYFGLFPTNTPVLDAANGRKARYCVTLVIGMKNHDFSLPKSQCHRPNNPRK